LTRQYPYALDYDDPVLAELYDQQEDYRDDVDLLFELLGDRRRLQVLEPFSGTGRILIPLVLAGHHVTGIDIAPSMVERARRKLGQLDAPVSETAELLIGDALITDWGRDLDLVILGSNCLYELSSRDQQKLCVRKASEALRSGGHAFVDVDNYRGDWGHDTFPQDRIVFEGTTTCGAYGRLLLRSLGFDEESQILRMKRIWSRKEPESVELTEEYLCRKRPVSGVEVRSWLEAGDFQIVQSFGNRKGEPFSEQSERAIFWARRR
jgi:SAM-dependent methyltransferase